MNLLSPTHKYDGNSLHKWERKYWEEIMSRLSSKVVKFYFINSETFLY